MKVTGTILLATSAAIGANAQVLKGTASHKPRRRFNKMKEADRRRLQSPIECFGIKTSLNGFGKGCVEQAGPIDCTAASTCESSNKGYNECFDEGTNITTTCVCIIPDPDVPQYNCNGDYGTKAEKPCCFVGEVCDDKECVQTMSPSLSTSPSLQPSQGPSVSAQPSNQPSLRPSLSTSPSSQPSQHPSVSAQPSSQPSQSPSFSQRPSASTQPSSQPSLRPSLSTSPSSQPSQRPSVNKQTSSPTGKSGKSLSKSSTSSPTVDGLSGKSGKSLSKSSTSSPTEDGLSGKSGKSLSKSSTSSPTVDGLSGKSGKSLSKTETSSPTEDGLSGKSGKGRPLLFTKAMKGTASIEQPIAMIQDEQQVSLDDAAHVVQILLDLITTGRLKKEMELGDAIAELGGGDTHYEFV